ncbi:MAG: DUF3299 domain-containing protein [Acidiferrobacterales bacterium]|nr:DUF3299 domain-containing protein [Acidiferrobacterales bacterium]
MSRWSTHLLFLTIVWLLSGCSDKIDDSIRSQYQELSWIDLKPEEIPVFDGAGEPTFDTEEDSSSVEFVGDWSIDQYQPNLAGGLMGQPVQSYAPSSSEVVSEMDGKKIRVPGFIVPVEFDQGNLVTEFFLVPYFGACIHKPPPPPNQTIYVRSSEPVKFESLYDPVWVMGTANVEQVGNQLATAAYTLDFEYLELFEDY